jgi:hypothetical protein
LLNKAGIHFDTLSRLSNLNSTDSGTSPLGDFAPLGLLHPDNLVTVEEAERVKGSFDLVCDGMSVDYPSNRTE